MDNREFNRLAGMYLDTIYRVALAVDQNAQDAEDIVQNTFIKLLEHREEFNSDEHAKRWLIRVAVNEGHMLHRKRKRENTAPLEEAAFIQGEFSEDERELMEALNKLQAKYREVIHLFYFEGYSSREIAQILEISEDNVRTRLLRARRQLKEMLKGDWE